MSKSVSDSSNAAADRDEEEDGDGAAGPARGTSSAARASGCRGACQRPRPASARARIQRRFSRMRSTSRSSDASAAGIGLAAADRAPRGPPATFCAICSHSGTRGSGVTRASWSRKARALSSSASERVRPRTPCARAGRPRARRTASGSSGRDRNSTKLPGGVLLLRSPEERDRGAARQRVPRPLLRRPAPARARSSTCPAARAAGAGGTRRGSTGPVIHIAK